MTTTDHQEKKNQRIAMITSIGIHGALFLLFFFMVAWRAPNPPLPEYGIELNFGTETQGSGNVQPRTPVGSAGTEEEEPEQPDPVEEEPQEEAQPAAATPTPTQPVQQEISKVESPVKVEEKKEEVKEPETRPEPKKEEVKQPEKPKVEPKKEEVVKPKVDENAVFKPKSQNTESNNKTTEGKAGEKASQGDDKNAAGDKGNPEGSLDAKALYGKQGGGGGPSLDLAGWMWDSRPNPQVPDNESGRVVFEIKVDKNGEIFSINTVERSVSPEAEQACKRAVQMLTFSKTGENVPSISTGRITFVIRAR